MTTIGSQEPVAYRFGPFVLYTRELRLLRDGKAVTAAPKVLETLSILVERAGEVVSRSEITARVWPSVFVEEGSLAQNIFQLRRLLDREFPNQKVIVTVPKRGYTFIPRVTLAHASAERKRKPIESIEAALPDTAHTSSSAGEIVEQSLQNNLSFSSTPALPRIAGNPERRSAPALLLFQRMRRSGVAPYVLVLTLICASAAGTILFSQRAGSGPGSADSRRAVLVLAFDSLESSPGNNVRPTLLADTLRTNLIQNNRLRVLQSTRFSGTLATRRAGQREVLGRDDLRKLREATGCDVVVFAQLEGSDQAVSLSAMVYDAGSGKIIGSFDRSGPGAQLPILINSVNRKIGGLLEDSSELP